MAAALLDKLKGIEDRYAELERRISDPGAIANQREWVQLGRERAQLADVAQAAADYRKVIGEIDELKGLAAGDDPELRELAQSELPAAQDRRALLETRLKQLLTPRDPNDDKNVLLEIRAGTGGEEASLFAGELFRMYSRYAERHGWRVETLSLSSTGLGGIKEVIAGITGHGAYSRLKFEDRKSVV